ncbi:hypothetical protein BESB_079580 [Besnoitia besnoiti]|uniref:Kazal-like domain-containing protein n=1 Tax=Besnoitia besnoiti TaxID=94643 RepID=A0A2A9MEC7_BESBE|nr:hypothetical protein BESB_079580 [Besnoitia besnoiti]PFH33742.1 hypothetical protein BESB_079580 [Besnoitia besnoiti]
MEAFVREYPQLLTRRPRRLRLRSAVHGGARAAAEQSQDGRGEEAAAPPLMLLVARQERRRPSRLFPFHANPPSMLVTLCTPPSLLPLAASFSPPGWLLAAAAPELYSSEPSGYPGLSPLQQLQVLQQQHMLPSASFGSSPAPQRSPLPSSAFGVSSPALPSAAPPPASGAPFSHVTSSYSNHSPSFGSSASAPRYGHEGVVSPYPLSSGSQVPGHTLGASSPAPFSPQQAAAGLAYAQYPAAPAALPPSAPHADPPPQQMQPSYYSQAPGASAAAAHSFSAFADPSGQPSGGASTFPVTAQSAGDAAGGGGIVSGFLFSPAVSSFSADEQKELLQLLSGGGGAEGAGGKSGGPDGHGVGLYAPPGRLQPALQQLAPLTHTRPQQGQSGSPPLGYERASSGSPAAAGQNSPDAHAALQRNPYAPLSQFPRAPPAGDSRPPLSAAPPLNSLHRQLPQYPSPPPSQYPSPQLQYSSPQMQYASRQSQYPYPQTQYASPQSLSPQSSPSAQPPPFPAALAGSPYPAAPSASSPSPKSFSLPPAFSTILKVLLNDLSEGRTGMVEDVAEILLQKLPEQQRHQVFEVLTKALAAAKAKSEASSGLPSDAASPYVYTLHQENSGTRNETEGGSPTGGRFTYESDIGRYTPPQSPQRPYVQREGQATGRRETYESTSAAASPYAGGHLSAPFSPSATNPPAGSPFPPPFSPSSPPSFRDRAPGPGFSPAFEAAAGRSAASLSAECASICSPELERAQNAAPYAGHVLCASDGLAYPTACDYKRARCMRPGLEVVLLDSSPPHAPPPPPPSAPSQPASSPTSLSPSSSLSSPPPPQPAPSPASHPAAPSLPTPPPASPPGASGSPRDSLRHCLSLPSCQGQVDTLSPPSASSALSSVSVEQPPRNQTWEPQCASDGNTYANPCVFDVEACVRQATGQAPLLKVHEGVCGEHPTPHQAPPAVLPSSRPPHGFQGELAQREAEKGLNDKEETPQTPEPQASATEEGQSQEAQKATRKGSLRGAGGDKAGGLEGSKKRLDAQKGGRLPSSPPQRQADDEKPGNSQTNSEPEAASLSTSHTASPSSSSASASPQEFLGSQRNASKHEDGSAVEMQTVRDRGEKVRSSALATARSKPAREKPILNAPLPTEPTLAFQALHGQAGAQPENAKFQTRSGGVSPSAPSPSSSSPSLSPPSSSPAAASGKRLSPPPAPAGTASRPPSPPVGVSSPGSQPAFPLREELHEADPEERPSAGRGRLPGDTEGQASTEGQAGAPGARASLQEPGDASEAAAPETEERGNASERESVGEALIERISALLRGDPVPGEGAALLEAAREAGERGRGEGDEDADAQAVETKVEQKLQKLRDEMHSHAQKAAVQLLMEKREAVQHLQELEDLQLELQRAQQAPASFDPKSFLETLHGVSSIQEFMEARTKAKLEGLQKQAGRNGEERQETKPKEPSQGSSSPGSSSVSARHPVQSTVASLPPSGTPDADLPAPRMPFAGRQDVPVLSADPGSAASSFSFLPGVAYPNISRDSGVVHAGAMQGGGRSPGVASAGEPLQHLQLPGLSGGLLSYSLPALQPSPPVTSPPPVSPPLGGPPSSSAFSEPFGRSPKAASFHHGAGLAEAAAPSVPPSSASLPSPFASAAQPPFSFVPSPPSSPPLGVPSPYGSPPPPYLQGFAAGTLPSSPHALPPSFSFAPGAAAYSRPAPGHPAPVASASLSSPPGPSLQHKPAALRERAATPPFRAPAPPASGPSPAARASASPSASAPGATPAAAPSLSLAASSPFSASPASSPAQCNFICPSGGPVVCGTDEQTYANECEVRVYACLQRTESLRVHHKGPCRKKHARARESGGGGVGETPTAEEEGESRRRKDSGKPTKAETETAGWGAAHGPAEAGATEHGSRGPTDALVGLNASASALHAPSLSPSASALPRGGDTSSRRPLEAASDAGEKIRSEGREETGDGGGRMAEKDGGERSPSVPPVSSVSSRRGHGSSDRERHQVASEEASAAQTKGGGVLLGADDAHASTISLALAGITQTIRPSPSTGSGRLVAPFREKASEDEGDTRARHSEEIEDDGMHSDRVVVIKRRQPEEAEERGDAEGSGAGRAESRAPLLRETKDKQQRAKGAEIQLQNAPVLTETFARQGTHVAERGVERGEHHGKSPLGRRGSSSLQSAPLSGQRSAETDDAENHFRLSREAASVHELNDEKEMREDAGHDSAKSGDRTDREAKPVDYLEDLARLKAMIDFDSFGEDDEDDTKSETQKSEEHEDGLITDGPYIYTESEEAGKEDSVFTSPKAEKELLHGQQAFSLSSPLNTSFSTLQWDAKPKGQAGLGAAAREGDVQTLEMPATSPPQPPSFFDFFKWL